MTYLIAGLGSVGRRHFRNLIALGEKDILLYRTHHSTLPDDELAGFPVVTDLHSALSNNPQAVIVANPTALHLEIAIPAAEAGCHILLEKPISSSMEGVDELSTAVERGGGQVLVGFQYRFHPTLIQAIKMLNEGIIGRPLSVRAVYGEYLPNMHPWEDYRQGYSARKDLGGGVILTLCHPLDTLRWMLGDVRELWAFVGRLTELELDVEDIAEIGLRFTSGVVGSVHLDYYQRPSAHYLVILGDRGILRWDNTNGVLQFIRGETNKMDTFPPPRGFGRNDMFLAEMRHFMAIVRGEEHPVCTLEDGQKALELALGAHESQNQGGLIRFQA